MIRLGGGITAPCPGTQLPCIREPEPRAQGAASAPKRLRAGAKLACVGCRTDRLASFHSNIIDVSAADSQGMEQHEYMDRARQYR